MKKVRFFHVYASGRASGTDFGEWEQHAAKIDRVCRIMTVAFGLRWRVWKKDTHLYMNVFDS